MIDEWSDRMVDDHYGRNYYGPGRHYFDGPYWTDDDLDVLEDEDGEEDS